MDIPTGERNQARRGIRFGILPIKDPVEKITVRALRNLIRDYADETEVVLEAKWPRELRGFKKRFWLRLTKPFQVDVHTTLEKRTLGITFSSKFEG